MIGLTVLAFGEAARAQSAPPKAGETTLDASPAIIAPGVISTPANEFRATVSPDNNVLVYVVTDNSFRHMTLVQAERRGGAWSEPEVVGFSGIWRDGDPAFAPDGRTLYFISNRAMPGEAGPRRDYNIWRVARRPDGTWGAPTPLGPDINTSAQEMSPSITRGGTLYFSRGDTIMRAEKRGDDFAAPVAVTLGQKSAGDPAIAPDESFIVFDGDGITAGDADLYVSCRTSAGWTAPSRFAEPVNSSSEEGDPFVSADGRTLYFFSRRVISTSDRAPRAQRATYAEIHREAVDDVYNGSRNLYEVDLLHFACRGP